MNTARVLAFAAPAALILAIVVGFWPVHANVGLGTADCGSVFRPVHAFDSYDVTTDPTGAGLTATGLVDDRCEAARSGPGYLARGFGLSGIVLLLVYAGSRRRRAPVRE